MRWEAECGGGPGSERGEGRGGVMGGVRGGGDTGGGEGRQRAVPAQRLPAAEQAGHRTLAATAERRGPGREAPPAAHAPSIGAE